MAATSTSAPNQENVKQATMAIPCPSIERILCILSPPARFNLAKSLLKKQLPLLQKPQLPLPQKQQLKPLQKHQPTLPQKQKLQSPLKPKLLPLLYDVLLHRGEGDRATEPLWDVLLHRGQGQGEGEQRRGRLVCFIVNCSNLNYVEGSRGKSLKKFL